MKKLLAFLGMLALLTAVAQESASVPPAPAEGLLIPAGPPPQAVRNTPLQELIGSYEQIRKEHEANIGRLAAIQAQLQELQRQPSANAFADVAVSIGRNLMDLHDRMQTERENQIAFKNDIDRYSAGRNLLQQEQSYLKHYLDELRRYGLEQEKAAQQMKAIQHAVAVRLDRLPPPPRFVNRLGIAFVLVSPKGQPPFYVSETALGNDQYLSLLKELMPNASEEERQREAERAAREGLTYPEAQRLALGIGHLSGMRLNLPSAKEAAILKAVGYGEQLKQAVWLLDKWNAPYEEREAMVRFGIVMGAVWDPAGCLSRAKVAGADAVSGELPEAHYPALGCIFVAPAAAGKAARLAQAEANYAGNESAGEEKP